MIEAILEIIEMKVEIKTEAETVIEIDDNEYTTKQSFTWCKVGTDY